MLANKFLLLRTRKSEVGGAQVHGSFLLRLSADVCIGIPGCMAAGGVLPYALRLPGLLQWPAGCFPPAVKLFFGLRRPGMMYLIGSVFCGIWWPL